MGLFAHHTQSLGPCSTSEWQGGRTRGEECTLARVVHLLLFLLFLFTLDKNEDSQLGIKKGPNTGCKINALTRVSFTFIYFYPKAQEVGPLPSSHFEPSQLIPGRAQPVGLHLLREHCPSVSHDHHGNSRAESEAVCFRGALGAASEEPGPLQALSAPGVVSPSGSILGSGSCHRLSSSHPLPSCPGCAPTFVTPGTLAFMGLFLH